MGRNDVFKFKRFEIYQKNAAMKVCTDAILLGSWATIPEKCKTIIDIGTGTGVLALMLAQRCYAKIDAVEIDKMAYQDALYNFDKSAWSRRLNLIHETIQNYIHKAQYKYDLLICNPPYFNNSLRSDNINRNIARHNDMLNEVDLLNAMNNLSHDNSFIYLILPKISINMFLTIAKEKNFYPTKITEVIYKKGKQATRVLLCLKKGSAVTQNDKLTLFNNKNEMTHDFIGLTKDFYLFL